MDSTPEPLARVLRDAPVLDGRAELVVLPNDDPDARDDVIGAARDWIDPEAPRDSETVLLRLDGNVTALGDVGDAGVEELMVLIASCVQDYVVDLTGAPWPTRTRPDGSDGVLDVHLDGAGTATWWDGAEPVAPVGELRAAAFDDRAG